MRAHRPYLYNVPLVLSVLAWGVVLALPCHLGEGWGKSVRFAVPIFPQPWPVLTTMERTRARGGWGDPGSCGWCTVSDSFSDSTVYRHNISVKIGECDFPPQSRCEHQEEWREEARAGAMAGLHRVERVRPMGRRSVELGGKIGLSLEKPGRGENSSNSAKEGSSAGVVRGGGAMPFFFPNEQLVLSTRPEPTGSSNGQTEITVLKTKFSEPNRGRIWLPPLRGIINCEALDRPVVTFWTHRFRCSDSDWEKVCDSCEDEFWGACGRRDARGTQYTGFEREKGNVLEEGVVRRPFGLRLTRWLVMAFWLTIVMACVSLRFLPTLFSINYSEQVRLTRDLNPRIVACRSSPRIRSTEENIFRSTEEIIFEYLSHREEVLKTKWSRQCDALLWNYAFTLIGHVLP